MTDTLISIISIFIGILGANLMGLFNKKQSLGLTGNTITGIFGSIFFIKLFGRLGFDPRSVMLTGEVNNILLIINVMVSFFGGILALWFVKWLIVKINDSN